MKADVLNCAVCGKEVRVVRLGQSLLTMGHLQNPKHLKHRVQLSPASRDVEHGELNPGSRTPARHRGASDDVSSSKPTRRRRGAALAQDRTPHAATVPPSSGPAR